ncbi:MAG: hypothetical protein JJU12_06005 [Chlamydiales bacterium]|nr:hypothetical protein [Chlamydiales bacterium]
MGKTDDGHRFAFRALILNNKESDAYQNLLHAMKSDNLQGFLEAVEGIDQLDQAIKGQVRDIFTPTEN